MNSEEFKVVHVYVNPIEAELAKNCLIASGINAMTTQDRGGQTRPEHDTAKGVAVVVRAEHYDQAFQILQGDEQELTEEEHAEISQGLEQSNEAKKEFDHLRLQELKEKASRKNVSQKTWIVALVVSLISFFVIPNRTLAPRIALAILFYAVIEFFTWRDCVKSERELKSRPE